MPLPTPIVRTILFCLLMIALASGANAIMDALWTRYDRSIFADLPPGSRQWFDPHVSWVNKWKDGDPKNGEAYFLSSTILVSNTDAWHFFKSICITSIILAFLAPWRHLVKLRWWWWLGLFFLIEFLYGLVFEGLYAHLLMR